MNTIIIRFILTPFLQVLLLTKKIYYDEKKDDVFVFFQNKPAGNTKPQRCIHSEKKGDKK